MTDFSRVKIAKCGHDYVSPAPQGRIRKFGECGCASAEREGNTRACLARRSSLPPKPRIAKCGHAVPYHPGPQAKRCAPCDPRNKPRSCLRCAADITMMDVRKKFCGSFCREVAYGQRLPEPLPPIECALEECDATFTPTSTRQRCCCERHGQVLYNRESRADGRQKATPWDDRRRNNYHARRARLAGGRNGDPVMLAELLARDGYRCGICGDSVDADAAYPDPLSKSIDHIVPLSRGGAHSPENCQLAHLRCNVSKGAKLAA